MFNNKYGSLVIISAISALTLVIVNYGIYSYLASGGEGGAFLYLLVLPLTPFLSLPATIIVYFIHARLHRGVFFVARMGIPLLFNLIGASVFLLVFWSPGLTTRVTHPPATLELTGVHSDKIGSSGDEKTLDVSITLYSSRAGEFSLGMQLMAGDQVISTSSDLVTLAPGNNVITYQFHGDDIRLYQLDGPYQVNVLPIRDDDTMDILELQNNQWQTAAYHWRDFGDELCYFLVTYVEPAPSWGTLEVNPEPNCAGGGYLHGTAVTITAIPNPGYQFVGWVHDTPLHSGPPALTLDIIREMEVSAYFEPQP